MKSRKRRNHNAIEVSLIVSLCFLCLFLSSLPNTIAVMEGGSMIRTANTSNNSNNTILDPLQKLVLSILPEKKMLGQEKKQRRGLKHDPRTIVSKLNNNDEVGRALLRKRYEKTKTAFTNNTAGMTFKLPTSAEDWCAPPKLPSLPYDQCKDASVINSIPFKGGLTNSLQRLLLGAIFSLEEDRCFVIDESESDLSYRVYPEDQFKKSFYERYYEPVGLLEESLPEVAKTRRIDLGMENWGNWTHDDRRIASSINSIPSLNLHDIGGHDLKRQMLKRLWRPKGWVRDTACARLEKHLGDNSQNDFMVFSVRRGDKKRENIIFPSMDKYITAAEQMARRNKLGITNGIKNMPTVFVATDDCSVVRDFRHRRPKWNFVSVCDDDESQKLSKDGFRHDEMKLWNHKATDTHFGKFMVELYAMATAKYFIG